LLSAPNCRQGPSGPPFTQRSRDTEEPDVFIALVRVCGGAVRVTCGSTRNRSPFLALAAPLVTAYGPTQVAPRARQGVVSRTQCLLAE
jgi:hypothetical protein